MKITIGKEGLTKTWQDDFPETTECVHCEGKSRIGFVAHEAIEENVSSEGYVCSLHNNDPDGEGYWAHDCASFATYICKECCEATTLWNQA